MTRRKPDEGPDWTAPRGCEVQVVVISHRAGRTTATVRLFAQSITSRPWQRTISWDTRHAHVQRRPAVHQAIRALCQAAGLPPPTDLIEPRP